MPLVTKTVNGQQTTNSGGCFGFMGRHSSIGQDVTEFTYHLGSQWNGSSSREGGLNADFNSRNNDSLLGDFNPNNFWTYLANNSAWSKYVDNLDLTRSKSVSINTENVGHAVIGTASMFRLGCKTDCSFIPLWNLMVKLGCHKGIALVCAYAASRTTGSIMNLRGQFYNPPREARPYLSSPAFGDDTPMDLRAISIGDFYGIINGQFCYTEDDEEGERNWYKNTGRYSQEILRSFSTGQFDFLHYIKVRLGSYDIPIKVGTSNGSGGMGRSTREVLSRNGETFLEPLAVIGLALQLTTEFNMTKRLSGIHMGVIHG